MITFARSSIAVSSSAAGTARLIKPHSSAVAGSMNRAVTSISNARLVGTLRERATAGVEQNNPTLIPETAKRASSELRPNRN
jgi:hypothetical protein